MRFKIQISTLRYAIRTVDFHGITQFLQAIMAQIGHEINLPHSGKLFICLKINGTVAFGTDGCDCLTASE
jgi:hypothetical protein